MVSHGWKRFLLESLFFVPTGYKWIPVLADRSVLIALWFQNIIGVHHLLTFRPLYYAPTTHSRYVAYFFVRCTYPCIAFITDKLLPNGRLASCERPWHCVYLEPIWFFTGLCRVSERFVPLLFRVIVLLTNLFCNFTTDVAYFIFIGFLLTISVKIQQLFFLHVLGVPICVSLRHMLGIVLYSLSHREIIFVKWNMISSDHIPWFATSKFGASHCQFSRKCLVGCTLEFVLTPFFMSMHKERATKYS